MHNSTSQFTRLSRHIAHPLKHTLKYASNLIFPPRCLGCDTYLIHLPNSAPNHPTETPDAIATCPTCRPTIYRLDGPGCPRCARPRLGLPGQIAPGVDELCAACLDHLPAFQQAFACFEYEGAITDAIQSIKYGHQLHKTHALARVIRPWMLEKLTQNHPDPTQIHLIPAPMHIRDLQRRGFNLPALILRQIAHKTPYKLGLNIAKKVRHTPPQAGLSREQRLKNLHDAFTASPPPSPHTTAILFDDVLTTTATAHQISIALLNAGYHRVIVFAIARAAGSGQLSDYI